jgi:hypothetical protein
VRFRLSDYLSRNGLLALTLSQDWFDERPIDPVTDDLGQRLLRNTFALVEREQALHIRRLTEILVDLINFSKTNSNVHYDHYLLYKELAEHQRRKADFDRYFNCENLNTLSSIDLTKRSIAEAEKKPSALNMSSAAAAPQALSTFALT